MRSLLKQFQLILLFAILITCGAVLLIYKSSQLSYHGRMKDFKTKTVNLGVVHSRNASNLTQISNKAFKFIQILKRSRSPVQKKKHRSALLLPNKTKTILFWYPPFNDKSMTLTWFLTDREKVKLPDDWEENGYEIDTPTCGKCRLTFDRNEFDNSSAVVFHARDINFEDMPTNFTRRPEQQFVWWLAESTLNAQSSNSLVDYFNLTMFVRRTSDIYGPYMTFPVLLHMIWKKNAGQDLLELYQEQAGQSVISGDDLQMVLENFAPKSVSTLVTQIPRDVSNATGGLIKRKIGLVAWVASNCYRTPGAELRYSFYEELLSAGLAIDVYGGCGDPLPIAREDPAFFEIFGRYKFYLAMENSIHCKDYITEKLWYNALYSGAVPVIFGPHKNDIAAVLPPKSYIHAEDFSSPAKLVTYIHALDKDPAAYAKHLEWRNLAKFFQSSDTVNLKSKTVLKTATKQELSILRRYASSGPSGFCGLCKRLHEDFRPSQTIHDMQKFLLDERPECTDVDLAREKLNL